MRNIVLIITDTFRYDNLCGRCAAMPVRTPELSRFIAEGATEVHGFYTGSFPTIPHRTDIATGRLGWPNFGWQALLDHTHQNHIAALLGAKGYATQLICDCPHLFNARFQHGFDAAFQHRGQEGDKPLLHLNDPIREAMPQAKTRLRPLFRGHPLVDMHRWTNREWRYEAQTFPAQTGSTAVRWLEENHAAGPFFLWVDFFDPHEPWDPPEYLVRRYDPDYSGPPMLHPNYGRSDDYTPAELKNLRAHYAAESELVDRWIGRVLQKMDDLGLWANTVVVVTSDHGMSLGEHGRTGKTNINERDTRCWPTYPEIGHVPFLVAAPDVPKGGRLDLFGQPMDFLPTVCDLAAVEVTPREPFHGRSFASALRAGSGGHREYVVTGCHLKPQPGAKTPRNKATTPFLITREWGYAPVGAEGLPELYDLRKDPQAETNVAPQRPAELRELHKLFLAHLREHQAPADVLALWEHTPEAAAQRKPAADYDRPTF